MEDQRTSFRNRVDFFASWKTRGPPSDIWLKFLLLLVGQEDLHQKHGRWIFHLLFWGWKDLLLKHYLIFFWFLEDQRTSSWNMVGIFTASWKTRGPPLETLGLNISLEFCRTGRPPSEIWLNIFVCFLEDPRSYFSNLVECFINFLEKVDKFLSLTLTAYRKSKLGHWVWGTGGREN